VLSWASNDDPKLRLTSCKKDKILSKSRTLSHDFNQATPKSLCIFMVDKISEITSVLLQNTIFDKKSFLISLASISFNPIAWNLVARNGMCLLNIRPCVSPAPGKSIAIEL